MMEEYDDLLTTGEACEALRVGYNLLYRLLHSGQLKGCRCGRVWRIPKAAVVAFILDKANLDYQAVVPARFPTVEAQNSVCRPQNKDCLSEI